MSRHEERSNLSQLALWREVSRLSRHHATMTNDCLVTRHLSLSPLAHIDGEEQNMSHRFTIIIQFSYIPTEYFNLYQNISEN